MLRTAFCSALALALIANHASAADQRVVVPTAVVCPAKASFAEQLAAKEIRRYLYLRSGTLLPLTSRAPEAAAAVVVAEKSRPIVAALFVDAELRASAAALRADEYLIATVTRGGAPLVVVAGGDPIGTLYGAYRLAERLGVRFYLHGDVVPDERIALGIPALREIGKPLFDRRGIQPFHDFPEGPDWWNADGYKAVLGQLPKLRMNFFGLHTYPEGGVGPEPATWIGRPEDLAAQGRVKHSYPSRHFTPANGTWGYRAMKTADYSYGAAALFDRDDYGADYMRGMTPWPKTAEDQNELFHRMGEVLRDSFTLARNSASRLAWARKPP